MPRGGEGEGRANCERLPFYLVLKKDAIFYLRKREEKARKKGHLLQPRAPRYSLDQPPNNKYGYGSDTARCNSLLLQSGTSGDVETVRILCRVQRRDS